MKKIIQIMTITDYNAKQTQQEEKICNILFTTISENLLKSESKIWHGHPVWFIDGNPIVGYSKQKAGIRLMFWSGIDFEEEKLNVKGKKFKDASIFYTNSEDINMDDIKIWLQKAVNIQWDYKNILKRKGVLLRLK